MKQKGAKLRITVCLSFDGGQLHCINYEICHGNAYLVSLITYKHTHKQYIHVLTHTKITPQQKKTLIQSNHLHLIILTSILPKELLTDQSKKRSDIELQLRLAQDNT